MIRRVEIIGAAPLAGAALALLTGLAALCGCGGDAPTAPPAAPGIVAPAPGATVFGSWVNVTLGAPEFQRALVWLDRDPATAAPDTVGALTFTVKEVRQGAHTLTVEYVDGASAPLDPPLRFTTAFATENLLAKLQSDVFVLSCALSSCHSAAESHAKLNLSSAGAAYASLVMVEPENEAARAVGMKRVVPFDTAASFLWMKINNPPSQYGAQMPRVGVSLSTERKTWIRDWIDQGGLPSDY